VHPTLPPSPFHSHFPLHLRWPYHSDGNPNATTATSTISAASPYSTMIASQPTLTRLLVFPPTTPFPSQLRRSSTKRLCATLQLGFRCYHGPLFASVPQPHDTVLCDVAIDFSIQDIMHTSRVAPMLHRAFTRDGTSALFSAALLALRFEASCYA
jgi:hypothetical protein